MRALEVVWVEIAAQFNGEDPRHADLQAKAAEVSARLQQLGQSVAGRSRRLPEPTEAMLAEMRGRVEEAFGHFNLRVTRA
jgi:hypothetical protein